LGEKPRGEWVVRSDWKNVIGLGVAGNFAGHLEQAGGASDFKDLETQDARAPKGVFPFYVPGEGSHFLHRYPVSADRMRLGSDDENHQIEPEVSLLCELEYEGDRIVGIVPREAMAHNDCSIRREGAKKISEKKNWGPESKGTASQSIPIDRFEPGGVLDDYRIASYLLRDGELFEYGVDSAVKSYSYMYGQMIKWLIDQLNDQKDEGPLENIADWLAVCGHPSQALISIGATLYTDFGETTFIERGDHGIVAVYDANRHDGDAIRRFASGEDSGTNSKDTSEANGAVEGLSLLRQEVI
jgi:hypothetical protein